MKMSTELAYIIVCRHKKRPHYIGPFDCAFDAAAYASRMDEIRWHVVTLHPDDASAPLSILSPTYDTAIRKQEASLARAMRVSAL